MTLQPNSLPSDKLSVELTPKMARFVQWLQDQQAQDMNGVASNQIWNYLNQVAPEEKP